MRFHVIPGFCVVNVVPCCTFPTFQRESTQKLVNSDAITIIETDQRKTVLWIIEVGTLKRMGCKYAIVWHNYFDRTVFLYTAVCGIFSFLIIHATIIHLSQYY